MNLEEIFSGIASPRYIGDGELCIEYDSDILFERSPFTGEKVKDLQRRKFCIFPDPSINGRYLVTCYNTNNDKPIPQSTRPMYVDSWGDDFIQLTIAPEDAVFGIMGPEILSDRIVFKNKQILLICMHRHDTDADYIYANKSSVLDIYIESVLSAVDSDEQGHSLTILKSFLGGPSRLEFIKDYHDKAGLGKCLLKALESDWDTETEPYTCSELALFCLSGMLENALTQTEMVEAQYLLFRLMYLGKVFLKPLCKKYIDINGLPSLYAENILNKISFHAGAALLMPIVDKSVSLGKEEFDFWQQSQEIGHKEGWKSENLWDYPEEVQSLSGIVRDSLCESFLSRNGHSLH